MGNAVSTACMHAVNASYFTFLAEGLVVYTDNFQVLASTCSRQRTIRATAEEGTRLRCTSSFSSNGGRLSFGWCHWYGFFYGFCNNEYNNEYTTLTSTSVNLADQNLVECSLRSGYRDYYYIFRIRIDITLMRGKKNTASCSTATGAHINSCIDKCDASTGTALLLGEGEEGVVTYMLYGDANII